MSYEYTALVWKQSRSSGNARLVMLMLADMANQGGVCWPSIAYVATHVRCTTRSVQQAIRDLVALGELEVKMNAAPGGANLYQLKLAAALPLGSGMGDGGSGIGDRVTGHGSRKKVGGEDISGGEKSSGVKIFQGGDEKNDGGGVKNFREGDEKSSPESVIEPAIEPVNEVVATTTRASRGIGDRGSGIGGVGSRVTGHGGVRIDEPVEPTYGCFLDLEELVQYLHDLYPRKVRRKAQEERASILKALMEPMMDSMTVHCEKVRAGVEASVLYWKKSGDDPQFMDGVSKFFGGRKWEEDWSIEAAPGVSGIGDRGSVQVLVTPEEEARRARIEARVAAIREQAEAEADRDGVPDGERSAYVERRMKELQLRRAS